MDVFCLNCNRSYELKSFKRIDDNTLECTICKHWFFVPIEWEHDPVCGNSGLPEMKDNPVDPRNIC